MKIITTVRVRIERPNGSSSMLEKTTVKDTGDNPIYEREEVLNAVGQTAEQFYDAHTLSSTKPL